MTSSTVHLVAHNPVAPELHRHAEQTSTVGSIVSRLRRELSSRQATAQSVETTGALQAEAGTQIAFLSRCVVLQAIGAAFLAGLWIAGLASKPFQGDTAALCWIILGIGALGIACVFLQRWRDVQWIATHVVRIGLLGTVVGLIIAFSAAGTGASGSPEEVKPMIAAVVNGMYVSLYATLLGIAVNLWLKINLRLLGNFHG